MSLYGYTYVRPISSATTTHTFRNLLTEPIENSNSGYNGFVERKKV